MAYISTMHKSQYKPLITSPPKLVYIRKNSFCDAFRPPRIMHKHDYLEIALMTKGYNNYTHDDQHYFIPRGSVAICNGGIFHAENPASSQNDFINVSITNINIPDMPRNCLVPEGLQPIFNITEQFSDICYLVNIIYGLWRKRKKYSEDIMSHLLCALVLKLLEIVDTKPVVDKKYNNSSDWHISNMIKEYIDKYYYENLSLATISTDLKMSPSLISHVFKREMGYPPMQYVTMLRIGEAQTLLTATDHSVSEISSMLGYNTPENFYIMFRKNIGVSPSQYRKRYAAFQD
ncbi:MAG: AraC family transcriptional regulator [Christensenellales bacterium]|jgi:AraC-like DNA-binding protein